MTATQPTPTGTHVPLTGTDWTLRAIPNPAVPATVAGATIAASVPGCVHTDLLAAGLICDPYLDDNETRLAWIGRTDWVYETTFDRPPGRADRIDLVCAGLDTVATITLNGIPVGRTENMHRGYRFDITARLRDRDNHLAVTFDSAYRYAEAHRDRLGDRPCAYPEPFAFIRKTACNFGWDWGPTLVTAGIWQEISLHRWSVARLAAVRPLATVADHVGTVAVHVEVDRAVDQPVTVHATLTAPVTAGPRSPGPARPGGPSPSDPARADGPVPVGGQPTVTVVIPPGQRNAVCHLTVDDPKLWRPRGYGDPNRYPLTVTLTDPYGQPLDTWTRRIGFRSVHLDTRPDAYGSAFTLIVNGQPIFVRGANWIPDDVFAHRVTRDRLARRLDQAVDAHINLLRVWGGGRYESDDFYDLADERGLLVQQDFLFACAAYPEEEPLRSEVEAEAREQVTRLTPHPSLVLWTGNNENIWGWHDWGWPDRLDGRTWGRGYYLDLLPRIVAELDPTRPYWPGSPWSGREDIHPNDPAHGTTHIWDVWNTDDYLTYRRYLPRFVAEFGYQAPPAYATLRRALSDDPLAPDSPGMVHHQKAVDGHRKLHRGLVAHLPTPTDFDEWHHLTQVNQARAIACGVEHFRAHRGICMGAIVWQLNDCWPVTSWSAVDGDGRRKPLWYALRRVYADRLLTIAPRPDGLTLVAVNDGRQPWRATVTVTRHRLTGEPRATRTYHLAVPPGDTATCPLPAELGEPEDACRELLVAEAGGSAERALWFFAEDRDIPWPAATYDATVETYDGGVRVHVTAGTILRDLTLYPDRLDPAAEVDQALVTLLPGESTTFTVRTAVPLDPTALTTRPVLRAVNR